MKAFHGTSGAGIAGLVLREHPDPKPGPREVVVSVRACSLNFREVSVLRGSYPLPVKDDVIMCADGAGEVVAIGSSVTRVKRGDRVIASMFPRWLDGPFGWDVATQLGGSADGMLAELVLLPEDAVVTFADHLSFEEAATLPCAGVTAWNALVGERPLLPGEVVLTLGSGGVSLFALQLAKLAGARVIATTSSEDKARRLRALGADDVIDYRRTPEWHRVVRELTDGRGVDQVIDVAGATLDQSLKATRIGGLVNFIGRLDTGTSTIDTATLYTSIASIRVVAAGHRAHLVALNRAIAAARLRPVIDRVFPFADAPDAFRYFETAHAFGKVVISQQRSSSH